MKFLRKIFGIKKWVTITSINYIQTKDIHYMEIQENNKTTLVLL